MQLSATIKGTTASETTLLRLKQENESHCLSTNSRHNENDFNTAATNQNGSTFTSAQKSGILMTSENLCFAPISVKLFQEVVYTNLATEHENCMIKLFILIKRRIRDEQKMALSYHEDVITGAGGQKLPALELE